MIKVSSGIFVFSGMPMEIIREASVPVFFVMRPAFQYCASWSLAAGKVARNGRNRAHTKTDERDIRPMVSVSLWTPTSRRLSRLADAEHRDPWCCIERIAADRKAQYRKLGILHEAKTEGKKPIRAFVDGVRMNNGGRKTGVGHRSTSDSFGAKDLRSG